MQLINKQEIENILRNLWKENDGSNPEHRICYNKALGQVQCEIDRLTVKEVDLEREMEDYFKKEGIPFYLWSEQKEYAKHFYTLGLKTQKGESKKDCETKCPNFDEAQGTPITK